MTSEHDRPADTDSALPITPTSDVRPEVEDDEVSGYVMSIPAQLQAGEASAEEDEVQT